MKLRTKPSHARATNAAPVGPQGQGTAKTPQKLGARPPTGPPSEKPKDDREEERRSARRWAAWQARKTEDAKHDGARAREWVRAWEEARAGGGVLLAWNSMVGLGAFTETVESSPHWETARAKPEGKVLLQAAQLLNQLWSMIEPGLQAANSVTPRPLQKRQLCLAYKVAKKAKRCLGEHLPYIHPEAEYLNHKRITATTTLNCVCAWQEALPLIEAARKQEPRASTEELVRGVIAARPDMGARLHLDDALKNAASMGADVFDEIRSYWGKGKRLVRVPRREVAFKLARWACNLGSAKSVQKLYEFARSERQIDV